MKFLFAIVTNQIQKMSLFISRKLLDSDIVEMDSSNQNPLSKKGLTLVNLLSGPSCRVFGIVVDRSQLKGMGASLADFPSPNAEDKDTFTSNSSQNPMVTARVIYTFQQICSSVELGDNRCFDKPKKKRKKPSNTKKKTKKTKPKPNPKKKKKSVPLNEEAEEGETESSSSDDDDNGNTDENEEATEEEEEKDDDDSCRPPPCSFTFWHKFRKQEKVEEYIQTITDEEGVALAYRFIWIVFAEPEDFDFDTALDNVLVTNALYLAKCKKPIMPNSLDNFRFSSNVEWYQSALSDRRDFSNQEQSEILGTSFKAESNPGSIKNIFSFKQSCDFITEHFPNAKAIYKNGLEFHYTAEDSIFNGRMRFLPDTFYVPVSERNPVVVFNARLLESASDRNHLLSLDTLSANRNITETQRLLIKENAIRTKHKFVGGKQVHELNEFGLRTDYHRIPLLFKGTDDMQPGVAAAVRHINGKMREGKLKDNGSKPWHPCIKNHCKKMDPGMSPFAFIISRNLQICEDLFAVQYYHYLCAFFLIWRLGVFDSRSKPFYVHPVVSGPSGSGKSFAQTFLTLVSIVGTYMVLAHQTAKSVATNINCDCMMWLFDELPPVFFDKSDGGGGDPLMKTVLSSQRANTMAYGTDPETGERIPLFSTANLKICLNGLLNLSKYYVSGPLLNRLLFIEVDILIRPHYDCSLKESAIEKNPVVKEARSRVIEELKDVQSIAACVKVLIDEKFLPEIDNVYALTRLYKIRQVLETFGVTMPSRRVEQVKAHMRSTAIMEAIYRVLMFDCEGHDWADFKYEDLMLLAPYLAVTEEHLANTLTQLEGSIYEENLPLVLKALLSICGGQMDGTDYYSYTVALTGPGEKGAASNTASVNVVLESLAVTIGRAIHDVDKRYMLSANIVYILKLLVESKHVGRRFKMVANAEGALELESYNQPPGTFIPSFIVGAVDKGQSVIRINKALLDDAQANNEKSMMEMAIEATCDKHSAKRRLISGKTYIGHENMRPNIARVIDVSPNEKEGVIMNMDHVSIGFLDSFIGEDDEGSSTTTTNEPLVNMEETITNESPEIVLYKEFCARNGINAHRYINKGFPVCRTWVKTEKNYPESFIL